MMKSYPYLMKFNRLTACLQSDNESFTSKYAENGHQNSVTGNKKKFIEINFHPQLWTTKGQD